MKTNIIFLSFIIWTLSLILGCSPSEKDVLGDAFIVTSGGQNIKLGLVEIYIYSESSVQPIIQPRIQTAKVEISRLTPTENKLQEEEDKLEKAYEAAEYHHDHAFHSINSSEEKSYARVLKSLDKLNAKLSEHQKHLRKMLEYVEGRFYISDLPTPMFKTKTDADGKFTLKLKPGKYALAASSSRVVGEGYPEEYYWLIWIIVDLKQQNKIMLNNDNLFERNSKENLINLTELRTLLPKKVEYNYELH